MEEMYDIVIIGSGPAGLEAAVTATIRNKKILVLGSKELSPKLQAVDHPIMNYLGLPSMTGKEMVKIFQSQIESLGIAITEKRVTTVYAMPEFYTLQLDDTSMVNTKTVILATGVAAGNPYVNEEKFLGRGVSYCATCDAPIYKGKKVIVIADSPKEEEEVEFLTEVCQEVTYFPLYKEEVAVQKDNLSVVKDTPVSIEGTLKANTLVTKQGTYTADGIFILRQSQFPSSLVPGLETQGNRVVVNLEMETNLPGLYAAGDLTGQPYQYIKAAGQGNVAALSAVKYLASKK